MNVAIIGVGKVGFNIAAKLNQENHNVTVIDADQSCINYVTEELDVLGIVGNGANPEILANVKNYDLLIAVTDNDEINILVCLIAKKLNIPNKIARVSQSEYFTQDIGLSAEELGIDLIINPEKICALEILNIIKFPQTIETLELAGGKAQLVGFKLKKNCSCERKTLTELKDEPLIKCIRFVAFKKEDQLIIPRGHIKIEPGETVYVMGKTEHMPAVIDWLGSKTKPCERVILAGGGKTAQYLAQELENTNIEVKLIEQDADKARELATTLKKTLVLHGNITDSSLLQNIGIQNSDYFIALTDDDETNILSCVVAKDNGAAKVIPLISKHEYTNIVSSIAKIDIPVGTKLSSINAILKFLRKGEVHAVSELREINAEVLEMLVIPNSKVINKKIMELDIPEEAVIGIVIREEEILIATGDLKLESNDKVIIFSKLSSVAKIEKLFLKKRSLKSFLQ